MTAPRVVLAEIQQRADAAVPTAYNQTARRDVPRLVKALNDVLELHRPEKRYQPDWDCEGSYATAEEAAANHDIPVEGVTFFEICKHCGEIEGRQASDYWDYLEALWPCPTVKSVTAALAGES